MGWAGWPAQLSTFEHEQGSQFRMWCITDIVLILHFKQVILDRWRLLPLFCDVLYLDCSSPRLDHLQNINIAIVKYVGMDGP